MTVAHGDAPTRPTRGVPGESRLRDRARPPQGRNTAACSFRTPAAWPPADTRTPDWATQASRAPDRPRAHASPAPSRPHRSLHQRRQHAGMRDCRASATCCTQWTRRHSDTSGTSRTRAAETTDPRSQTTPPSEPRSARPLQRRCGQARTTRPHGGSNVFTWDRFKERAGRHDGFVRDWSPHSTTTGVGARRAASPGAPSCFPASPPTRALNATPCSSPGAAS
jgi:hypothetical protein